MKHSITILWGENPEQDGREPETYEFDTKAELEAFMKGVDAMDGWLSYDIVEDKK